MRRTTFATMLLCTLFAAAGCAGTPEPNISLASDTAKPDTSRLYRVYAYYPNAEVYHSSFQRMYYWHEGDEWVCGQALPEHIRISDVDREFVKLPTSTPPLFHDQIAARYPSLDALLDQEEYGSRDWKTEYERIVTVPTDR
ncbi:MAG: hypothetical protein ACYTGG_08410 [Planctomycetota bacterium]